MGSLEIDSLESIVLLNPSLPKNDQALVQKHLLELKKIPSHVWMMTSGTSAEAGIIKLVGLSWHALKKSAESVNEHFGISSNDIWYNPLPIYHVGGLGIYVRSFLSKSVYLERKEKWNPSLVYESLIEQCVTMTSLVPAQLYDLVKSNYSSPPGLKKVFIGGGVLPDLVKNKALNLGWPIVKTYGMTECSSQVAVTEVGGDELKPLEHVQVKVDQDEAIHLKSPSLFSYVAVLDKNSSTPLIEDRKFEGWYLTEDRGEFDSGILKIYGRGADFIKIGGENVSLQKLENILKEEFLLYSCEDEPVLIAQPDERLGHIIVLVKSKKMDTFTLNQVLERFHQRVHPYEKVRQIYELNKIPRSALGKPLRKQIEEVINKFIR